MVSTFLRWEERYKSPYISSSTANSLQKNLWNERNLYPQYITVDLSRAISM